MDCERDVCLRRGMEGNRKRARETTTSGGNTSSTSGTAARKVASGYAIQSSSWLPCLTPKQASFPLNFNFWMNHRYISDSEVEEFILSILCPEYTVSDSFFVDKSWNKMKKSNRLILISMSGITPNELSDCIANSSIPQLANFSSVPVRHTISATLQHLPSTPNLALPDNFWRYSDTAPASTLLYWPVVPAISYEKVNSLKRSILSLFAEYRLVFQMTNAIGEVLGEIVLVSDTFDQLDVVTGKARIQSMNLVEIGDFQILPRISSDVHDENETYQLIINVSPSEKVYKLESLPVVIQEANDLQPVQPLPLIFFSVNPNCDTIPVQFEDGEEAAPNITFKKEDPNLIVLTLSDVKGSKYPALSWTLAEPCETVNVNDPTYWSRFKDLFIKCLALCNHGRNCFDPFLTSPFLLDMMGYVTAPSKGTAKSKFSNFSYQTTSSLPWNKGSKPIKKTLVLQKHSKGDNPFLALGDDGDSDESGEVSEGYAINSEEICIDDVDSDHDLDTSNHLQSSFPENNRLYDNVRAICALDCEMCETSYGSELTRISLICPVDGVILDQLVKPSRPIIDYHTKFSGITAELLNPVKTTFSDIIKILPTYIGPDTILVGHSLESDLNILGLCHQRIIDTVGLFPHPQGLPFKKSLKLLAKEQLKRDIQSDKKDPVAPEESGGVDDSVGHDSIEDACVPLELVLLLTIDHYQQYQSIGHQQKYLPNVWSSMQSLLTTSTTSSSGEQTQISCERYTLFHSLLDIQRQTRSSYPLRCDFHQCEPYRHIPPWERYSMGYRHDSSISLAYHQYINDPYVPNTAKESIAMNIQQHGSVSDAITGAIHCLQSTSSLSNLSPQLIWIDMPCNLNISTQSLKSCQGDCLSPQEIDQNLEQLLRHTQSGDVICVLTQGDLMEVKKLICKKQKLRWLESSVKTGKASPFLQSYYLSNHHNWTSDNEEELIKSAAHAIAGSFFIQYIN